MSGAAPLMATRCNSIIFQNSPLCFYLQSNSTLYFQVQDYARELTALLEYSCIEVSDCYCISAMCE